MSTIRIFVVDFGITEDVEFVKKIEKDLTRLVCRFDIIGLQI